jgi:hypothetical protein
MQCNAVCTLYYGRQSKQTTHSLSYATSDPTALPSCKKPHNMHPYLCNAHWMPHKVIVDWLAFNKKPPAARVTAAVARYLQQFAYVFRPQLAWGAL